MGEICERERDREQDWREMRERVSEGGRKGEYVYEAKKRLNYSSTNTENIRKDGNQKIECAWLF